jgi:hypothetical protein
MHDRKADEIQREFEAASERGRVGRMLLKANEEERRPLRPNKRFARSPADAGR